MFNKQKQEIHLTIDYQNQEASNYIRDMLQNQKPCLICRFGSVELSAVLATYNNQTYNLLNNSIAFIQGKRFFFWLSPYIVDNMIINAGFFPEDKKLLFKYGNLVLSDLPQIDILGSWINFEHYIAHLLANSKTIPLKDLEPYFHSDPWSSCLEGKKVLVIHPFEESILKQYSKRELLFKNQSILPNFTLITIKAVQSIAHEKVPFNNWFEAFDSMRKQIDETDFDIALIGAGAYGMPLAAYIKKTGKKAVHLGGALQILFGIKGKRWENNEAFKSLINEHWVYPLAYEIPDNAKMVEDGCYW